MGCAASVGENQQLLITQCSGKTSVKNGPGIMCVGMCSSSDKRDAVMLGLGEYCTVHDDEDGNRRTVEGPQVVFLGPRERVLKVVKNPVLKKGEYCRVRDDQTGNMRVEHGPKVVKLTAFESVLGGVLESPVLQEGQYCKVQDEATGDVRVECGPAVVSLTAHEHLTKQVTNMPVVQQAHFCKVRDERTGTLRVEHGPTVVRPGPYDEVIEDVQPSPVLRKGEFVKVKNVEDGEVRIEKGPLVVMLGAYDQVLGDGVRRLPVLQRGEFCRVANEEEGAVSVEHGPCVVDLGPHDEVQCDETWPEGIRKCPDLSGDQYLVVRDDSEGTMRNVVGPVLFKPGPYDVFGQPQKIVVLARNEYVRIRDNESNLRIERGEKRLVPDPLDTVIAGIEKAVEVDEHHAVLVRNVDTGKLELVTEHGLFFPSPYQEIEKVQNKIVLEPFQTVVCKDMTGVFYYASGDTSLSPEERGPGPNFFLPAYHEVVTQSWSTDLRKEHATAEEVWMFDTRPSYMNYEFTCRTLDNVELVVDVYFFWRIIDVKSMVNSTADPPGDTCTHARSMIMQQISKIKLMEFLERFNELVRTACLGDGFYADRGIELLSAEVLKFECTSQETNAILREIIQETCDRLKRTERQRGENEVAMARLDGEIAEERKRQELVEVRKSHLRVEARIEGEAEGTKIAAFISKLAKYDGDGDVVTLGADKAYHIYEMLRRYEADAKMSADKKASIEALGKGSANLYVLPDDVNLHFGTMQRPLQQVDMMTPPRRD
eukprot:TRINITY_DN298_c0_g3_i1.p1 TRINITY_DN298_c0_g3~~TRINITY_DN298_c0_g3_i1.p1  ORF type:complete len:786 (+),score=225.73 TRINITY_DN298_c0_g3_i1:59-2359(+)